jgi:glycerol-1-phosphate dehydrogenase [NAD(P)+]
VQPSPVTGADLQRRFGADIGASCWREFAPKSLIPDAAVRLEQRLRATWDDLRARLRRDMIPAATIAAVLARAGCPASPADIGLTPQFYAAAVRNARFLRDRYTFLDLADDSGRLAALWPD